jgi:diacylglycerol kinase family enzyme
MRVPRVIFNPHSASAVVVRRFLDENAIPYSSVRSDRQLRAAVRDAIDDGEREFLLSGGDGTINRYLQAYMALPLRLRRTVRVGIIPGGKANDLARALGIPLDVPKAFDRALRRRAVAIDVFSVNGRYFITGGGLGFLPEVVRAVNALSARWWGRLAGRWCKDLVYSVVVLRLAIFGYRGIDALRVNTTAYSDVMALAVQNQPFIGKRFLLAPDASNTDGIADIALIPRLPGFRGALTMVRAVVRGSDSPPIVRRTVRTLQIVTKRKMPFMADGELLLNDDHFRIAVYPRAIKFYR